MTIWPSISEEVGGVGGEASGISPHEPKECLRSPENNREVTASWWTCDVVSNSCLLEPEAGERGWREYRGAMESLKEEAGSSWGRH